MVERIATDNERRDESRRGRQECMRHAYHRRVITDGSEFGFRK